LPQSAFAPMQPGDNGAQGRRSARPMGNDTLPLRGFKTTCSVVGAVYVLLASTMFARGAHDSMERFGVPEPVLSSPHFADFFHFLFVHMSTLGVLIALLGWCVERGRRQRLVARVLCVINVHYTYLDIRTSDTPLGNGLYQGPASAMPIFVDFAVLLAFAYLGTRRLRVAAPRVA
jgi:hypothetical protein